MGLGMSRLPAVLDATAAPLPAPAAPAITSPGAPTPAAVPPDAAAQPTGATVTASAVARTADAPAAATMPAASSPAVVLVAGARPASAVNAPVAAENAATGYVVEVALFGTSQRGVRLVDDLIAAGFRAFHRPLDLGSRGFFQQVLIGPFGTRADADRDLPRLRQRGGHDDARVAAAPRTGE
jgi:cell division septation protein DedD